METQKKAPASAAILAAALWGIIGLWNRTLMAAGLSPLSIVVVRNLGGMLLLAAFFAVKDRSVFRVERRHLKYFFGTGVVSVVFFTVCYFSCQKLCPWRRPPFCSTPPPPSWCFCPPFCGRSR